MLYSSTHIITAYQIMIFYEINDREQYYRRVVIAHAPAKINCRDRFGSIEECRGGVLCRLGCRGVRHSGRVSVDVKTAAGTRVSERAGHVQNAREAIIIII